MTNPKDDRQRQEGEAKGGEYSPKTGRDQGSESDSGGRRGPSGWPDMQGEGNRDAARDAEPRSDEERRDMERAEREGRSHARK